MDELFVLDTFAWVEYFIGSERGEKVKNFIETDNCVTPTIVIAELSAKYTSEKDDDKLKFVKFNTAVIALNDIIAELAGKIRTEQRKKKKDFGIVDSIIYATALSLNAKVVSGDPHFNDVKEAIII